MDLITHISAMFRHRIFTLTELIMSLIISISCLLIHFRQHFRLQCINRHYTTPDMPKAVQRISGKFSGIDPQQRSSECRQKHRSSIFSKETLVHPEDAVQWCLRSIDDQEFDFFPRSFLWYQLFLVALLSVILYKFIMHPIDDNHFIQLYTDVIDFGKHSILHRSSLLLFQQSSLIDWVIIYAVLILINWESLFVFYRYYSTTYTAKHFNTIDNSIVFKLFTLYALSFILLFVAQIHFYYYIFPFIIIFMSLFILCCSYKTSQILIQQFKQMDLMMESFGSNRDVQNAMRESVYFIRSSSMISSICCILYLSLLLIAHNMDIIFYLPILWSMVCILLTLNFIRNRNFIGKICCCCTCRSHTITVKAQLTADKDDAISQIETNVILTNKTSVTVTNTNTNTKTMVIHHEIGGKEFALDVLYDTDGETILIDEDENEQESEYNMNEDGTIRFYPTAMTISSDQTPKDLNMLAMDHSTQDSQSLDQTTKSPENIDKKTMDSNQKREIIEIQQQWKHKWFGKKAKSHDPHDTSFGQSRSYSTQNRSGKSVRFKDDNHLAPNEEQKQHRRVQSERSGANEDTKESKPAEMSRSPSLSNHVYTDELPQIASNHSDPVQKKRIQPNLQQKDTNHQPSHSFQSGDKMIKKRSRRTLSRRLIFRNLPTQVQKLTDFEKQKVEEFANLNHMMTLHGFCEKNQFFQFELCEMQQSKQ